VNATAGQVVGAVLLPPIGVYLKEGDGRNFWIAAALTVLAFVPGVVFALWRVLRRSTPAQGAT